MHFCFNLILKSWLKCILFSWFRGLAYKNRFLSLYSIFVQSTVFGTVPPVFGMACVKLLVCFHICICGLDLTSCPVCLEYYSLFVSIVQCVARFQDFKTITSLFFKSLDIFLYKQKFTFLQGKNSFLTQILTLGFISAIKKHKTLFKIEIQIIFW